MSDDTGGTGENGGPNDSEWLLNQLGGDRPRRARRKAEDAAERPTTGEPGSDADAEPVVPEWFAPTTGETAEAPRVRTIFDPPAPLDHDDEPEAPASAAEVSEPTTEATFELDESESPAATGFSWNLAPDPTAPDPALAATAAAAPAAEPVSAAAPDAASDVTPPADVPAEPELPVVTEPEPAPEPAIDPETEAQQTAETVDASSDPDVGDDLGYWFAEPVSAATVVADEPPATELMDIADVPTPAADAAPTEAVAAESAPTEAMDRADIPTPLVVPPAAVIPAAVLAADAEPAPGPRRTADPGPKPPRVSAEAATPAVRRRRTIIIVIAIVAALAVLAGLFFIGTRIPGWFGSAPAPVVTSAPPTETATPEPTAPQPAGVHAWDQLFGGECVDPFLTPWAEDFTVVDCAAPHAAQLVYRGAFDETPEAAFPGEAELASQINVLCTAAGVIDLAAASGYPDLQVQGSFPVTEEQWTDGQRNYYCFVNRSSGEPLSATVAGPGPAPAA
ncbi:hypothetical protein MN032_02175 [Agromyces atrinae]|uniref:hypothetical protein n=1 Tax=Agromyces atrinae TaxID=592376 RepID=UPI001F5AFF6C|nr:hypothetical protein [Agromyces atrinae]MCI2956487.1 hypothetical protein [Agromyces atrinae]